MGGLRIPEDQKRANTVNIDTDDEESSIDENDEESVIEEEEEEHDCDDEHDDFEEITDQLSDYPDIALRPNSLYVYYINLKLFDYCISANNFSMFQ